MKSTISPIKRWICHGEHGVHLQTLATHILSQVASSSLVERNWSTHDFIHYMQCNKLGLQNTKDLIYVHPNLHLAYCKGLEYSNGASRDWDVDPKSQNLGISFIALDLEEHKSEIGNSNTSPTP